jgi:glycosyltransferase involved in cell wall biosynthesis
MPSREEGFPRVLLEAMACSLAFVATDVGGVREVVPPGSSVVPAEDVAAIASGVDKLLSDDVRRTERAAAGSEWVKQYDLPKVAKEFIDLFSV